MIDMNPHIPEPENDVTLNGESIVVKAMDYYKNTK